MPIVSIFTRCKKFEDDVIHLSYTKSTTLTSGSRYDPIDAIRMAKMEDPKDSCFGNLLEPIASPSLITSATAQLPSSWLPLCQQYASKKDITDLQW